MVRSSGLNTPFEHTNDVQDSRRHQKQSTALLIQVEVCRSDTLVTQGRSTLASVSAGTHNTGHALDSILLRTGQMHSAGGIRWALTTRSQRAVGRCTGWCCRLDGSVILRIPWTKHMWCPWLGRETRTTSHGSASLALQATPPCNMLGCWEGCGSDRRETRRACASRLLQPGPDLAPDLRGLACGSACKWL